MAIFDIAVENTIKKEGIFSNNPNDTGGKTKYGITETILKEFGDSTPIEDLTLEEAKKIYEFKYWKPLNLDKVNNQEIANQIFDFGVNCGINTAGKAVQTSLNLLNYYTPNWLDLIIDGIIGTKTLDAINSLTPNDIPYFLKILKAERYIVYKNAVLKNSKNKAFIRGWINRIWPS